MTPKEGDLSKPLIFDKDCGNEVVNCPIYDEYQEDEDNTLKFDIHDDGAIVND